MILRSLPLLAAALALAACGGGPQSGTAAQVAAPIVAPAVQMPPVAAVTPPKRLDRAGLVGRTAVQVTEMFGQPRLLRREPPAEVWQYAGGRCTLLVFLYPANGSGMLVRHAETVARRASDVIAPEDCIEGLLRTRPALS